MGMAQMFTNERMDKQIMLYPYNGILLSFKKRMKCRYTCHNMYKPLINLENIMLKRRTQKVVCCRIPLM